MYLNKFREKIFYKQSLPFLLILFILWAIIYLPNLDIIPLSGIESKRISIAFSINDLRGFFNAEDIGRFYSNKTPIFSFILSIFINSFKGGIAFVSRLPSAFCVIIVSIISYYRLNWLGRSTTFFISILLLVSPSSIYFGRLAEMDMLFAGLIYLSLVECLSFYENRKNKINLILTGIMQGFAFLIKGPFGIAMLIVMILIKSVSLNEMIKIGKILFPIISFIVISYFGFAIFNNYLDLKRLFLEILIRFNKPLSFERFIGERLIAIFYSLPILFILILDKNNSNFQNLIILCKKYIIFFVLVLFLLPGFQSDYIAPLALFSLIPSGIVLSNWLKNKKIKKFFPLIIYFVINIILFTYLLPNFVGKFVLGNNATDTFLMEIDNYSNPQKKINILFTEQTEYKAPYFYSSEKNFNIGMLENLKILKNEVSSKNQNYFLITNTKLIKTKELIDKEFDGCFNVENISKEFYRAHFFSWPDSLLFSKRVKINQYELPLHAIQTLYLYKILLCNA